MFFCAMFRGCARFIVCSFPIISADLMFFVSTVTAIFVVFILTLTPLGVAPRESLFCV